MEENLQLIQIQFNVGSSHTQCNTPYSSLQGQIADAQQVSFAQEKKLVHKQGESLFLLDSIIRPPALNSLSTAVDVDGGVRYPWERQLMIRMQSRYRVFLVVSVFR